MKETHSNTHWLPWVSAISQYCCLIATLLSWLNLVRHNIAQLQGGLIWCLAAAFCLLATAVLIEAGLFGGLSSSASESSSVVSRIMATRFRPASRTGATGPSDSASESLAAGGWEWGGGSWSGGGWAQVVGRQVVELEVVGRQVVEREVVGWQVDELEVVSRQVLGWQVVEMVELWWLEQVVMVEGWLHGSSRQKLWQPSSFSWRIWLCSVERVKLLLSSSFSSLSRSLLMLLQWPW